MRRATTTTPTTTTTTTTHNSLLHQQQHHNRSPLLKYVLLLLVVSLFYLYYLWRVVPSTSTTTTTTSPSSQQQPIITPRDNSNNNVIERKLIELNQLQEKHPFVSDNDLLEQRRNALIDYQVHSWNDLDQWEQGMKKGVTWFKFDLFYTPATHPQCNNNKPCFLLTHDPPVVTERYNTSDQVIEFLLKKKELIGVTNSLHIALCFKYRLVVENTLYRNPCLVPLNYHRNGNAATTTTITDDVENDQEFNDEEIPIEQRHLYGPDDQWIELVDQFYQSATTKLTTTAVQFILDESGTHGMNRQCLMNKWRPWISTYISVRDPMEAFLLDDESKGYDRFRILNEPIPSYPLGQESRFLQRAQRFNYGKFGTSENKYPFLVWEPSKQKVIWNVAKTYLSGNYIHGPGLRFSINIDPIMFKIFVAHMRKVDNSAWNWAIRNTLNCVEPKVTRLVVLDNVDQQQQRQESHFLILLYQCNKNQLLTYRIKQVNVKNSDSYHHYKSSHTSGSGILSTGTGSNDGIIAWKSIGTDIVYMVTRNGHMYQYRMSETRDELKQVITQQQQQRIPVIDYDKRNVLDCEMLTLSDLILVVTQSKGKITEYQSISIELISMKRERRLSQLTIRLIDSIISSVSITVDKSSGKSYLIVSSEMRVYGIGFIVNTQSGTIEAIPHFQQLYSTTQEPSLLEIPVKPVKTTNNKDVLLKPLGIGNRVSIRSEVMNDGVMYLAMVWDGGFCWNSPPHNLQARRVCANSPLRINHRICDTYHQHDILQYTLSTFDELIDRQRTGGTREDVILSPCDPNIFHGVYDKGTLPSLLTVPLHSENMIRFISVQQGSRGVKSTSPIVNQGDADSSDDDGEEEEESGLITSCICGTPIHYHGIILDSFTLPTTASRNAAR